MPPSGPVNGVHLLVKEQVVGAATPVDKINQTKTGPEGKSPAGWVAQRSGCVTPWTWTGLQGFRRCETPRDAAVATSRGCLDGSTPGGARTLVGRHDYQRRVDTCIKAHLFGVPRGSHASPILSEGNGRIKPWPTNKTAWFPLVKSSPICPDPSRRSAKHPDRRNATSPKPIR